MQNVFMLLYSTLIEYTYHYLVLLFFVVQLATGLHLPEAYSQSNATVNFLKTKVIMLLNDVYKLE